MLILNEIKNSPFFETINLKKGEVLFREGERDTYLYIVFTGELEIKKSTHFSGENFKTLAYIHIGKIIGEGAIGESRGTAKQVEISAYTDSELLRIDGGKFEEFISHEPQLGYSILMEIIHSSNTRLLKANREITANHEVNVAISKIKDFSSQGIYKLLVICQGILEVDQIMFFEKNLVMPEYFKLKFDSKKEHSIENIILKFPGNSFDINILLNEGIEISKFFRVTELTLGEESYGYILVGRNHYNFDENEEKLLENTAGSLVGVIHQKKILEEQKNKNYVKSI